MNGGSTPGLRYGSGCLLETGELRAGLETLGFRHLHSPARSILAKSDGHGLVTRGATTVQLLHQENQIEAKVARRMPAGKKWNDP